jgi:hypothetical protein
MTTTPAADALDILTNSSNLECKCEYLYNPQNQNSSIKNKESEIVGPQKSGIVTIRNNPLRTRI